MVKGVLKYLYDRYYEVMTNPDPISLRSGTSYKAYRELKTDPHLWSSIQQRKASILTLQWQIEGNEREKIAEMLKTMDVSRMIRSILEAVLFGFQPIEIIYDYIDNEIRPVKIAERKQENFVYDTEGELQYYAKGTTKPQPIPEYKIINPQHEATAINPYGEGLLSKCYWAVQFKTASQANWVEFAEKFGFPFIKATYEQGATDTDIDEFKGKIKDIAKDNVLIYPDMIKLETESIKATTSKELFNGVINMCNTEISKAILSQTLTTEVNIGSYAAAAIHYKIKREVIEGDIGIIERAINELLGYYYEINRKEKGDTKFRIVYNNQDNKELIERDEKITKMLKEQGKNLSQEYIQENYGLKEGDIEG